MDPWDMEAKGAMEGEVAAVEAAEEEPRRPQTTEPPTHTKEETRHKNKTRLRARHGGTRTRIATESTRSADKFIPT